MDHFRTRLFAVLLIATALPVIACGPIEADEEPGEPTPAATSTPDSVETAPAETPTPPPEPTPTADPTPEPTPTPHYPDHYELPDLQTLPPEDFRIEQGPEGNRELRFTSNIANLGMGPLMLLGGYEASDNLVHAIQRIRTNQNGEDWEEREVGAFEYFGWHDHWHFVDFNKFELWTYDEDGEPAELVVDGGKHSWCITETDIYRPTPEVHDPYAIMGGCDAEMQALATGWVDTYEWHLQGQELDLSGVEDGRYAFVSTVNPDGLILEIDDTNNSLVVYIEIEGWNVSVLDGP